MNSLPSESSWHLQHLWVAVSDRSHVGPVPRNPKSANRLFETCPAARITVRGRGLPSGGFSARLPVSPFESRCPTPSGDASESTPHGLDLVTSVVRLGSVFATSARPRAREDVPGALGRLDQPAGQQEHDGYEESTEDQELKVHPAHGQRRPSRRRLPPGLLPLYPAFSPAAPACALLSVSRFFSRPSLRSSPQVFSGSSWRTFAWRSKAAKFKPHPRVFNHLGVRRYQVPMMRSRSWEPRTDCRRMNSTGAGREKPPARKSGPPGRQTGLAIPYTSSKPFFFAYCSPTKHVFGIMA